MSVKKGNLFAFKYTLSGFTPDISGNILFILSKKGKEETKKDKQHRKGSDVEVLEHSTTAIRERRIPLESWGLPLELGGYHKREGGINHPYGMWYGRCNV